MAPHPALIAVLLLVALVAALGIAWRWFRAHLPKIVKRTQALWRRLRRRHPRLGAFIAGRFARGEYLGLHLTIGLAVSLLALWLFRAITEGVVANEPLTHFDLRLLEALHRHSSPAGVAIFLNISRLASPELMIALAVAGAVLLAGRREWIMLLGWCGAFAGGTLLDRWLKIVIHRERPSYAAALLHTHTWSFPSGHAMGALVGYGMLAYVFICLWPEARRWQPLIVVLLVCLVLSIGLSRMYLGVHYFSDVMGGYAAGTLWVATCISGIEVARRWRASRELPPRD